MTNHPEAFVAAARELVGAKWRHRGRKPWAVDCVGLVVLAARKAGVPIQDQDGYGREPWEDRLRRVCREQFGEPIPLERASPGCVALIRWGKGEPSHVAIVGNHPDGGLTLIHATAATGVAEIGLAGRYPSCVVEVYRPRFP